MEEKLCVYCQEVIKPFETKVPVVRKDVCEDCNRMLYEDYVNDGRAENTDYDTDDDDDE